MQYSKMRRVKKRKNIMSQLEKIDERFKIIEEVNPLQFLLKFEDKIKYKSCIELKNGLILEILYNSSFVSVYEPIRANEKRKRVLKKINYDNSKKIIEEIQKVIDSIDDYYV